MQDQSQINFWWDHEETEDLADSKVHVTLYEHVRALEEIQKGIHALNLYNAKLYTNRKLSCLTWGSHVEEVGSYGPISLRDENLIANGVDTATALIGKQRPKATPIPRDADFSIERMARKLDTWLYAEFKSQKAYAKMQQAFNDCCWAQIAGLFVGVDENDEIYTERVMPDEIVVDQRECQGEMEPIQVHRRRLVAKVVLTAQYPEFKVAIAKAGSQSYTSYRSPSHEMVVVVESWKLALPGESAGKHAVVIEGATLEYEDYTRDRFPFIFLRWNRLPTGFYAKTLVEEGAPFQLRHNELSRVIRLAQDLMCVPRIFVESQSKIIKQQIDNEIAKIYGYRQGGKPPTVMTWPAVAQELYAERVSNMEKFFNFIGISAMSAQSKLPDGVRLDSSKALREANYKQTERFQRQSTMLEDAYLELAEHYLEHAIDIYSDRKAPKKMDERTLIDEIDWKKLGRPGLKYTLQLEASSISNMTPAAREDELDKWANNGLITPDQYKGLLNHPDMDEEISLFSASIDDIKAVCEDLDNGILPQPDPLQNLTFGIPFIHKVFLKRKRGKGVPPEIVQNYRDWLAEARSVLEGEEQPAAPSMEQQAAMAAQSGQQLSSPVGPDGVPIPALAPIG